MEMAPATGPRASAASARARLALAIILTAYFCLGLLYSVRNPVFEAPDENWHFAFVRHVAAGRGLPSLLPGSRVEEIAGEAGQPPLYYLLAGALTSWIPAESLSDYYESNPSGSRGYLDTDGNKNVWVHLKPDTFPWQGEFLAAHLARCLSLVLGALAVAATYATARELFPDRPAVWPTAAAINALIPQFLFITAAITNDAAAAATGAGVIYLTARIVNRGPSVRRDLLLGLALGLAALSKLSLLMALPFAGVVVALVVLRGGRIAAPPGGIETDSVSQTESVYPAAPASVQTATVSQTVAVSAASPPFPRGEGGSGGLGPALLLHGLRIGGATTLVAGWWYVRNWLLYRDFLGLGHFVEAVGAHEVAAPPPLGEIVSDLPGLWASFWALFGWFSITVEPAIYYGYGALTLLGLAGLGWRSRAERRDLWRVALLAAWFLLVFGALVRYRLILLAFQGRLLFPAVGAIAILLALGLHSLGPRRARTVLVGVSVAAMLVVAAIAPDRYIAPAYAPRPLLTAAELAAAPTQTRVVYLDASGGALELLGYSPARPRVDSDGKVRIDLYWQSVAPLARNQSISVQLFDWQGKLLARDESYPGRGSLPTSRLRVGDAVRESRTLVPVGALGEATTAKLVVAVHKPNVGSLEARDAGGASLGVSPVVGRVGIGRPVASEVSADPARTLGGQVALSRSEVERSEVRAGEPLRGELDWQCVAPLTTDFTVFVQLVGRDGLASQHDSRPKGGAYPTSWWSVGEVVTDEYELATASVPAGEYRLIAGMYDLATGQRLAGPAGDHLDLGTVRVVR